MTTKKVVLMQGLPGSGQESHISSLPFEHYYVCSSLRDFAHFITDPINRTIIVDHPNTKLEDILPFWALAEAFNAQPEIHYIECDTQAAHDRANGVPLLTLIVMKQDIEKFHREHGHKFRIRRFK